MLRRFSTNFALFSMLIDILVIMGSLWLSSLLRPFLNSVWFFKSVSADVGLPIQLFGIFPIITIIIFSAFSLYDGKKFLRLVDEFSALTFAFLILSIAFAGILYLSFREVSRALFVLFVLMAYCGLLFWRVFSRAYFRLRKEHPNGAERRILVVGAGSLGKLVCENITAQAIENLCIVGYLDDDGQENLDEIKILGKSESIELVVQDFDVTDVIIALPHTEYQNLARIISMIEDSPVRIWVALGFFDLALYKLAVTAIAGIPVLDLRASALSEYQLLIKRAFDLVFGGIALVFSLPLMILSSLMIWLSDHGPIIFKQQRVGENGRLFTIYKFRTMILNAEHLSPSVVNTDKNGNIIYKTPIDNRITAVGKFLRRYSLDELPQLFNVLEGSMSLVGPRPELPWLVEKYQPWQRKRFTVPPGITGWWQVNGRSDKPMHLNTEDDLYYIQNYSLSLDIVILIRTIWSVIIGKGSY